MHFRPLSSVQPKLGVIGASRIVEKAILRESGEHLKVEAIAARDLERARDFAKASGIPHAYGDANQMLHEADIDCVYVATPNSTHADWTLRALRAGKHVLCEKPFALNVEEAQRCVEEAERRRLLLMEAHHWRYHPLIQQARSTFTQLRPIDARERVAIAATLVCPLDSPNDIRLMPELGPGVLMDLGCYCIQWVSFIADAIVGSTASLQVETAEVIEGAPGIDLAAHAKLLSEGESGLQIDASIHCDMRKTAEFKCELSASASNAKVVWMNPLMSYASTIEVFQGASTTDRYTSPHRSTYRGQLDAFLAALREGVRPPTSAEGIVRTQKLLDDCYAKAGVVSRRELSERAKGGRRDGSEGRD